jgi:glutamate formiminotransferase/formiminotetrahydrofolate cyclodeaminase
MIDLRNHEGVHPRIGVVDVVPFVPWRNLRLEDCVNLARSFAGQIAEEFALPVYLYGQAAIRPQTNRLASIRRGSLADLAKRMTTAALRPDFGPQQLDLRHGAIAIGARDIMIAYNIEIATKDLTIAELIAARIRTSGSSRFGRPGLLPALQAIGWYLPSRGVVQVSTNILDYQTTPLHQVFQVVGDLAREYGCRVQSSEIVGMLPLAALLQTGRTLIADANILEEELIDKTIDYLGLSSRQPFAPSKRIIEYALRTRHA